MKFGDKLIVLRKKHGLSQEELASKLNVSRQSVSKWESNNTYPETDKIVQICNIFDCRMDDLINDKVIDINQCERKNKNNLSIVFDSLLEFVTKSINMFTSMKFTSIVRCVIELIILVACLFCVGFVISEFGTRIIMKLFGFFSENVYWFVYNVIYGIFEIVLVCLSAIIVIHVFKIRYLDFYDGLVLDNKNEEVLDDNDKKKSINCLKEDDNKKNLSKDKFKFYDNKPKIIIRDKHTTFAFLAAISKIIIGIWKAIVAIFSCFFIGTLVSLVALFIFGISLSKYSILFIGIIISILSLIVINVLILLVMINYIINKKSDLKIMTYIFLAFLILLGVGIGIGLIGFTDFTIKDSMADISEAISKEIVVDVNDDMIIQTFGIDGYKVTIDNSISDDKIKIIGTLDKRYFDDVVYWIDYQYGMKTYTFHNFSNMNLSVLIDLIYDDLENKIFRSYYSEYGSLEIVCNSKVAKMLINNAEKIYLVDYKRTDDGYEVYDYRQKIFLDYNCNVKYNAIDGSYSCDAACVCTKKVFDNGLIEFDCSYK